MPNVEWFWSLISMNMRSLGEWEGMGSCFRHGLRLMFTTVGTPSSAVDIYNAKSGSWSTAALSSARSLLSSATLPDLGVAFFAGGWGANSGLGKELSSGAISLALLLFVCFASYWLCSCKWSAGCR
jgi:hypothetical protein